MTRNEVNSLAGRLHWAVDTDMMNAIRKNGGELSRDDCLDVETDGERSEQSLGRSRHNPTNIYDGPQIIIGYQR